MKIELPQVGESVTEGIIGKWLKQVGDTVEKYEPLVEVVTDKVDMEVPSPVSGILTNIVADEGQTVQMGRVIAEIRVEGEAEEAAAGEAPPEGSTTAPGPEAIGRTGVLLKDVAPVGPTGSGGPVPPPREESAPVGRGQRHSPAVQRLAQEHGIDLSSVTGTGMGGRVTRRDVQNYLDATEVASAEHISAPGAESDRVPLSPVRRLIAQNMIKSATQIPQVWTMVEADVSGMVQLRESAKAQFLDTEGVNLTYLSFVVKAVAESLKENPLLNSSWGGDAIIIKRLINLGIAVAAPDGLVVPVIKSADTLTVVGLAKAVDDLTKRAREGELNLEDVQGGTFTVNNTGALGSTVSQPLINPPQAAIIATETIVKRPVVIEDSVAIRSVMNLCLTFDHRILDGLEASSFINAVKRRLEAIGPDTTID